jgi:twitching motility protein PilT
VSVVTSLLRAIDKADGEALVMHVGDKPYVVTGGGPVELASRVLTVQAMNGMLDQLLPGDSRQALAELGAVERHLPADAARPGILYTVVAARGGDDIWIEVRRRKEAPAPEPAEPPASEAPPAPAETAIAAEASASRIQVVEHTETEPEPEAAEPEPEITELEPEPVVAQEPASEPVLAVQPETPPVLVMELEPEPTPVVAMEPEPEQEPEPVVTVDPQPEPEPVVAHAAEVEIVPEPEPEPTLVHQPEPEPELEAVPIVTESPTHEEASAYAEAMAPPRGSSMSEGGSEPFVPVSDKDDEPEVDEDDESEISVPLPREHAAPRFGVRPEVAPASDVAGVVVPMARASARLETGPRPHARPSAVQQLLRTAAARGASALYLASQARASIRVDGEIRVLEEQEMLTGQQLEVGLLELMPAAEREALRALDHAEWACDVAEVGRVQCLGYRDHRGPGVIFKMLPARAISTEQMGLSPQLQALCAEPEGLLLVAGARAAGKSTLLAALVDQINRTRCDHVITVESKIQFVHENRSSFVSQREVRGDDGDFAASVRGAMREGPDVLVVDDLCTPEVAAVALRAASSGQLVIATVTALTTTAAVEKLIDMVPEERRQQVGADLAEHLRGVVAQTLLRKNGGGRVAAREVLVNVPAVASLIREGHTEQLTSSLNSGRRIGMVPFNDALLGLVQGGGLDMREAYRKSPDQQELLALLNREGIDTSFAEKLA